MIFTRLYTLSEVIAVTNIGYITLLRLIKSGKLKAFKVGKSWRVTEGELNQFIGTV